MNPTESNELLRDLARLRDETGIGLLVIDHDMSLIMRLCDRIVVLNRGRVVAEGSAAEIQTNPAVIEAYIGRKRAETQSTQPHSQKEHRHEQAGIRRLARRLHRVSLPQARSSPKNLVIGAAISKTGWNAPYDSPVMDGLLWPSTRSTPPAASPASSRSRSRPATTARTTRRTRSSPRSWSTRAST